jgi:hypothetical protein
MLPQHDYRPPPSTRNNPAQHWRTTSHRRRPAGSREPRVCQHTQQETPAMIGPRAPTTPPTSRIANRIRGWHTVRTLLLHRASPTTTTTNTNSITHTITDRTTATTETHLGTRSGSRSQDSGQRSVSTRATNAHRRRQFAWHPHAPAMAARRRIYQNQSSLSSSCNVHWGHRGTMGVIGVIRFRTSARGQHRHAQTEGNRYIATT